MAKLIGFKKLKMSSSIVLLTALLCATLFAGAESKRASYLLKKPQCTEKRHEAIELGLLKAVPLSPKNTKGFPVNYKEVQVFCRNIKRVVAQNEAFFKECYSKTVLDYANILIYTTKQNLRKYCGKRGSRVVKDMLKLAPCANKHVNGNPATDKCYWKFFNQTAQLINIKNDKVKIPHSCCYFAEAVKCGEEFMNTIGCLKSQVPMLMDFFRSGTSSITDIMCGEYNDQTDACARLGPAPVPAKPNTKNYLSPVSLLVDLLESIKEFTPAPNIASGL